jgi:hypothetical protein
MFMYFMYRNIEQKLGLGGEGLVLKLNNSFPTEHKNVIFGRFLFLEGQIYKDKN